MNMEAPTHMRLCMLLVSGDDERAVMLTEMIVGTFERAYMLATQGVSLQAMLIDYDIQAAGSEQTEAITKCGRSVIKAAAAAVQRNIPFDTAMVCLLERLHT